MVSSKRGEEKVLNLQPWWPWRFKEQVLSQSTDSLTNCNLFCNLGLLIISSLLQQKLLLRLAIATKIFVAISFQRYFIATKITVTIIYCNKYFVAINYINNIFCCNKVLLIIIKILYCNKLIATKIYCNKIFVAIVYCHNVAYCNKKFRCNKAIFLQCYQYLFKC